MPDAAVGEISIAAVDGGSSVVLSFETSANGVYGVEARGSMAESWGSIISDIPGTGGEVAVTNAINGASGFYRAYIQE